MALVTFKGWEGKWWRNIKPGRAAVDAALTVLPGVGMLGKVGQAVGQRVGSKLIRAAGSKVSRFFRSGRGKATAKKPGLSPGHRMVAGGSKVTSGPLVLGKGQAFKAGGTAFNIRNAAKVGGGVAAAGAGAGIVLGKNVQPSAAVSRASVGASPAGAAHPAPIGSTSSSPSPMTGSSSGTKRCGCPAGQRMLCFKRKHNPEAEAKRKAKRKAARASSKARTAKRTAKAQAAVAKRKARRTAKKVRKAVRRLKGKR